MEHSIIDKGSMNKHLVKMEITLYKKGLKVIHQQNLFFWQVGALIKIRTPEVDFCNYFTFMHTCEQRYKTPLPKLPRQILINFKCCQ